MDILLNINRERKTTFLMVTHNPDLECYADRILYVRDGVFEKQILNETQATIDLTQYLDAINRRN
jgi:putative ABC transport system ATP-binding protein